MNPPKFEFAMELNVTVGTVHEIGSTGAGIKRFIPITGGTVSGPGIQGSVLAGGADSQVAEANGLTFLDARYVIETVDGVRIEIWNRGIRHASPEVTDRLVRLEDVSPDEYYFRTTPSFTAPEGRYAWLRHSIFVAIAERHPDQVVVRVWRML